MTVLAFTLTVFFGSFLAGFLGALTGLGGGVVLVPLLTLALGVDIRYAIGSSLVSVIATSTGAAAAYIKEGYTNIRIGMFLEAATVVGAVFGAILAAEVAGGVLAVVFGVVLLLSAYLSSRTMEDVVVSGPESKLAALLRLGSTYPSEKGDVKYQVRHVPGGFSLMFGAGIISGLLGIGGGAIKVLAMDQVMGVPFKVSTTTSNFMIGVTAAASAGVYLNRGYIDPGLAMPVMLGVLCGSTVGARVLIGARTKMLRQIFSAVILVLSLQMIYKGLTGAF